MSSAGTALLALVRRDARGLVVLAGALNLLLPLGFLLVAVATGESFYEMFWGESDAISWFSSVQLLLIGAMAYVVHEVTVLVPEPRAGSRLWLWLVFAAGFLFLALDERFELHEALRDDLLGPAGWFGDIPGLRTGDVGLYIYLAIGLLFAGYLLRELRTCAPAHWLFAAALVLSTLIVIEDGLMAEVRERLPLEGFWDSAFEEIGELWAQFLFLTSFVVVLRSRCQDIATRMRRSPE